MSSPAVDTSATNPHKIGIVQGVAYIIGNVIGSGIFVTPTSILRNAGSVGVSLAVWVVCAAIAFLSSFCYIELGTSVDRSGSDFAYQRYVGWEAVAFTFVWTGTFLSLPATSAVLMEAFGEYILEAVGPILCLTSVYRDWLRKLLGFMLIWFLCYLNLLSLRKRTAVLQVVFTVTKLMAMAILIGTGFYLVVFKGWNENFTPAAFWQDSNWSVGSLVFAIYGGMWSYTGLYILNFGAEDLANPRRTLPVATIVSVVIITGVYLAINCAYFIVLTKEEILESDAVAATFSGKALGYFRYVLPLIVALVVAGSMNGNIFVASRFMFAASKNNCLPKCFSVLSVDTDSPRVAVLIHVCLSLLLSFVGSLEQLINYVVLIIYLQQVFTMTALLYIRVKKIPVNPDAVKYPLVIPAIVLALSAALVLIPIVQAPVSTLIGLGIWLSGFAVYFMLIRPKQLPLLLTKVNVSTTVFCEKLFLSIAQNYAEVPPPASKQQKNSVVPADEITRF